MATGSVFDVKSAFHYAEAYTNTQFSSSGSGRYFYFKINNFSSVRTVVLFVWGSQQGSTGTIIHAVSERSSKNVTIDCGENAWCCPVAFYDSRYVEVTRA